MWTCPILQPLFQLMSTLQKMGKWKRRYFWPHGKISRLKTRFNSPLKAQIVTLVSSSCSLKIGKLEGMIFQKVLNYQIEKKVFWPLVKISRLKMKFNSLKYLLYITFKPMVKQQRRCLQFQNINYRTSLNRIQRNFFDIIFTDYDYILKNRGKSIRGRKLFKEGYYLRNGNHLLTCRSVIPLPHDLTS